MKAAHVELELGILIKSGMVRVDQPFLIISIFSVLTFPAKKL